jgi:hypothetical protein
VEVHLWFVRRVLFTLERDSVRLRAQTPTAAPLEGGAAEPAEREGGPPSGDGGEPRPGPRAARRGDGPLRISRTGAAPRR